MNCPNCQKSLRDGASFCDQCGQSVSGRTPQPQPSAAAPGSNPPSAPPPDQFLGRVFDSKYEIISKLGEGGMGTVYRARRLVIGDEVAIKVLLPKYVSDAEMLERFRREARAAAMLHHPNVVTIFDYGEVRGQDSYAYIVMELLDGETLRDLLRREGRLSPARALRLLFAACAGVGSAHRRNVFHRDLKPDNILIVPSREDWETESVKVVDFGIAKLRDLSGENTLTQFGSVMGTPHYMSPEQCRGDRLDARSDVYSLGVILYEMLAGGPPYVATSATGVIAKHLTEPPPRLPTHLNVPLDLEETISRALSKDPVARQQDAVELARELQSKFRWIQSPEEHHAPSPLHVPVDPSRLHSGPPHPATVESQQPGGLTETRRETTPAPGNGQAHGLQGGAAGPHGSLPPQPAPPKPAVNPLAFLLVFVGGLLVGGLFTFLALWAGGLIDFGVGGRAANANARTTPTATPTPTPTPRPTPYASSFENSSEIGLGPAEGAATLYPSSINVYGHTGAVVRVTVTLEGIAHQLPSDIDVLLVGPAGQKVLLMSDNGGRVEGAISPVTITFSDTASAYLPDNTSRLSSGTFRPSNSDTNTDTFPSSAPPGPYSRVLSSFHNTNPNGTWRLFARDDAGGDQGKIAGWSLFLTIDPSVQPSASSPPVVAPPSLSNTSSSANMARP